MTIQIVLSAPPAQIVTVNYATSNGSATAGSDYNAVNGLLVFAPGQTNSAFTVPIIDDNLAGEFGETVNLGLSSPANATLGLAAATLTLVDDDLLVGFSSATYQAGEGSNTAKIIVVLNSPANLPVKVDYRTRNGSAHARQDYATVSGTLTISPGLTSNSFSVPITEDTKIELDETVRLILRKSVNATLGLSEGILTIKDNDEPAVEFSSATYDILEGAGAAMITVTLSSPSPQVVTVLYATSDGTATTADYYTSAGVLTIPAGSTESSFSVSLIDDALPEADETVTLTLSAPVNAGLGGQPVATLTIFNDD